MSSTPYLELAEGLGGLVGAGQHTEDVESDSLAQRSALSNGDLVTLLNTESRGDVGGNVLVSLLVTGVLGDEVKVLAADDDGTVHLGGDDSAGQDTATDGDETGEGALLVDVLSLNGGLGGTETQTNILVPPAATLARAPGLALGDKRDVRLLLESTLRLDGQLGSHFCGCLIVGREGLSRGECGDVCQREKVVLTSEVD